jgi:hypothetical protein
MKSPQETEQLLEHLGRAWPADVSIVERVMGQLERDGARCESATLGRPRMKSLLAIAASVSIAIALWWNFSPAEKSLYAQALAAMENARTIHEVTKVIPSDGKPPQIGTESWCERGVGFREDWPTRIYIANQKNSWIYRKQSNLWIRSESTNINEAIDRRLDLKRTLDELKKYGFDRYPAADEQIDGRRLEAYLVTYPVIVIDPAVKPDRWRAVIMLDEKSRIVRGTGQIRLNDQWVTKRLTEWQYDVPIDRELFKPKLGDDAKIIEVGAAFDEFVNLDNAIYREDHRGIIFAIHRAERFDNDGVLVVSSVRGTPQTLAKYHPWSSGIYGLDWYIGPATNLSISPQGDSYFRIELAEARYRGIDICWWVVVPRGTNAPSYQLEPGKVKLPVGYTPWGEFAKANFTDEQGVTQHAMWDATIELPEQTITPSLDEIADGVYADMTKLAALSFRQLHMGVKPGTNTRASSNPDETTAAEYRAGTERNVMRWHEIDLEFQLTGQFTEEAQRQAARWGTPAIGVNYNPLVDDFTLAEIAKRTSIERLYLDGTRITDAGLRELAPLANLRELSLNNTPISDRGLKNLEGLTALKKLSVHATNVTPAGIAELVKAIPDMKVSD